MCLIEWWIKWMSVCRLHWTVLKQAWRYFTNEHSWSIFIDFCFLACLLSLLATWERGTFDSRLCPMMQCDLHVFHLVVVALYKINWTCLHFIFASCLSLVSVFNGSSTPFVCVLKWYIVQLMKERGRRGEKKRRSWATLAFNYTASTMPTRVHFIFLSGFIIDLTDKPFLYSFNTQSHSSLDRHHSCLLGLLLLLVIFSSSYHSLSSVAHRMMAWLLSYTNQCETFTCLPVAVYILLKQ